MFQVVLGGSPALTLKDNSYLLQLWLNVCSFAIISISYDNIVLTKVITEIRELSNTAAKVQQGRKHERLDD